jgi:hypothetical protein
MIYIIINKKLAHVKKIYILSVNYLGESEMAKINIDKRNEECAFIQVGNYTVYVDDSTEEQIIEVFKEGKTLYDSLRTTDE